MICDGGSRGPVGRTDSRSARLGVCTLACARLALALVAFCVAAQTPVPVVRLEFRTDPPDAAIRPYETVAVQILAFGPGPDALDPRGAVRIGRGPASLHLPDPTLGWLSKPFRHQGIDRDTPVLRQLEGFESRLFQMAKQQSHYPDAVLFSAAGKEGEAVLTATLEGVTASLRIRIDPTRPPTVPAERVTFGPEPRAADPYRPIAEHYAPFVAQETWFQPRSDYISRFDMDGDWRGDNNWDNAPRGSTQAWVYYAVMETETHWFLIYNFFHPRDYSDKCSAGACHENDNEGMILTVAKDGSPFGRILAMETLAHNKVYSYRASNDVSGNFHNIEGEMEFVDGSHPVVFVQAGGHGVYGPGSHSGYSLEEDRFLEGTGVTYVYKGVAERPRHPADREVGYDLLPIYDHWWLLAHASAGKRQETFSSYYRYRPFGERPESRFPLIAGAFLGRKHGRDMAKPFWGWHDNETRDKRLLATGQWALDPAYAVTRNLTLPGPVSLQYVFNPYLSEPGAPSAPPD